VDLRACTSRGATASITPSSAGGVGANITSDPETGIGSGQRFRSLPPFARGGDRMAPSSARPCRSRHYRKISDADAAAMAAYLKSVAARAPTLWSARPTASAFPQTGARPSPGRGGPARGRPGGAWCLSCRSRPLYGLPHAEPRERWRAGLVAHRRRRPAHNRLGRSRGRLPTSRRTRSVASVAGRTSTFVRAITQGVSADGRRGCPRPCPSPITLG